MREQIDDDSYAITYVVSLPVFQLTNLNGAPSLHCQPPSTEMSLAPNHKAHSVVNAVLAKIWIEKILC